MGCLSLKDRVRIVNLWRAKFAVKDLVERLAEGVEVSRAAIYNLVIKFNKLIQ